MWASCFSIIKYDYIYDDNGVETIASNVKLGNESASHAIQVFGGHGYIAEWGMEQNVRDARIAQISIRNERLAKRVDLHLALGGSF